MNVVCAILIQKGRFLLARRPPHKNRAHHWEFPGGKINLGEDEKQALLRELFEELKLTVKKNGLSKLGKLSSKDLTLHFFPYFLQETFSPQEHSALGWFKIEDLKNHSLCPLDSKACEIWKLELQQLLNKSLRKS